MWSDTQKEDSTLQQALTITKLLFGSKNPDLSSLVPLKWSKIGQSPLFFAATVKRFMI